MFRRRIWSSHLALWVAVCALLLKAAVPLLASASAGVQGKTLVEVCTVYGIAIVALPDGDVADGHAPHAPVDTSAHAGEHCALTALMALAAPGESSSVLQLRAAPRAPPRIGTAEARGPDVTATWVARLKHGPPSFA